MIKQSNQFLYTLCFCIYLVTCGVIVEKWKGSEGKEDGEGEGKEENKGRGHWRET